MELFSSPARRDAILADRRCTRARYAPGEVIYARDRFDRCLGLVLSGQVRVAKEGLVMSILGAGDLFGAAALFRADEDGGDYAATLTALTECEAALLPEELVRALVRDEAGFAEGYIAYLAARIRYLSARVDALSAGEAQARLAQFLLDNMDADARLTLPAAELARRIGVGRATLYRAFESLEKAGFLRRTGKTIAIVNTKGHMNP